MFMYGGRSFAKDGVATKSPSKAPAALMYFILPIISLSKETKRKTYEGLTWVIDADFVRLVGIETFVGI